jgi:hypothetical protein
VPQSSAQRRNRQPVPLSFKGQMFRTLLDVVVLRRPFLCSFSSVRAPGYARSPDSPTTPFATGVLQIVARSFQDTLRVRFHLSLRHLHATATLSAAGAERRVTTAEIDDSAARIQGFAFHEEAQASYDKCAPRRKNVCPFLKVAVAADALQFSAFAICARRRDFTAGQGSR